MPRKARLDAYFLLDGMDKGQVMKDTCLAALATTKHRSLLEPASAGITKKPGRDGS
jgi:hypothetical protein